MAKPRVNIGCPQHGGLNPPYKTTVIHVGESEVNNICAYCPQCGVFYTTAMAILLGVADPIEGKRVKRGVMFNKEKHDPSYSITYEASPALKRGQRASGMPKDELKKPKKSTQYGSEPVFRADKRPKPLPEVTGYAPKCVEPRANAQPTKLEVSVPKVEEFYVADRWFDEETDTCPDCNSRIYARQYNVPVYGEGNIFYAYYVAQLFYCTRCHKYVMAENEFRSFTRKINAHARKNHVRPKNMTGRYDSISDSHLYSPIADIDAFQKDDDQTSGGDSMMDHLSSRSFLAELGYNTSIRKEERQRILQVAIRKFGRRKTVDHLRFLITTRKRQTDGIRKYAYALSVWQDDLNYIESYRG